jgi:hypothetical protein
MTYLFNTVGRRHRLRALTVLAVLVGACDSDRLTTSPDSPIAMDATDSLADSASIDTVALADTLTADDSLAIADSLFPIDTTVIAAAATRKAGIPFGPFALWSTNEKVKTSPVRFTSSYNAVDARGIVRRINAARALNQRLFLFMTPGHRDYMTRGRFDLAKWKRRMNTFNQPSIRAAVAAAVRDGVVLGTSVLDEPNTKKWGPNVNKALVDQMCRYVKNIFPTLPAGAVVVHWWRPNERYRRCDFIIDQWAWWHGPNGPGAGAYTGNVTAWRNAALSQARKDGIAVAFSMNLLDGGVQNWKTRACPSRTTGGKGTVGIACRMTAQQVRDWGIALGPAGCALLMWRHDQAFLAKSANVRAMKEVAVKLANSPSRSCRRPG